ncbi:MAG: hypothetical protein M1818_002425 [Claussenomyces sp. TS43310]|nr:MAG: hypothetical protein M1818_002425 [Claussenomyces sp. TS43310]
MAPTLSGDDIDDLLYLARAGESQDLTATIDELCKRHDASPADVLLAGQDPHSGNGPLHMAAANGHSDLLTTIITLLSHPTPQNETQLTVLNARNVAGNTALHWAALNGHLSCVRALIDAGADPTITNSAGHDAVYEAELNDKKDVVDWVLQEGQGLEEGIGATPAEGEAEAEAEGAAMPDRDDDVDGADVQQGDEGYGESMEGKIRAGLSNLDLVDEKKVHDSARDSL